MVVDDRFDIRALVQHYLEQAGARVITAADGIAALAMIEKVNHFIDAIVMDMQMPKLDGYETVRRLRVQGFDRPVIALTAGALVGERKKCLQAGCSDYLSKPIKVQQLLETLAHHLSTSSFSQFANSSSGRILLVDDSTEARTATAKLLHLTGFEVITAVDGQSALAAVDKTPVDVVILDISLPDMDGYTLARQLRNLPGYERSQFIA